jgi:hypothetical protein
MNEAMSNYGNETPDPHAEKKSNPEDGDLGEDSVQSYRREEDLGEGDPPTP